MKKRVDGRYQAYITIGYTDEGKTKRKYVYGKTKKEVESQLAEIRVQLDKGILVDDKNILFGEWADEWLKTYKANKSNNTKRTYKDGLNHLQCLYSIKLKDIKTIQLQRIINNLHDEGKTRIIEIIRLTAKQIFDQAIKNELIYKNPVTALDMPSIQKTNKIKLLSPEQIDIITTVAKTHKAGAFMMTLLYTGIRKGEAAALTWDDIDFKSGNITINKAVEFIKNQAVVKETKTQKSNRSIPILLPFLPILKDYKNKTNSIYVFCKEDGNMLSQIAIRRLLDSFLYNCNLLYQEKYDTTFSFTLHQFRHTCASILYKAGVGLKEAQEFLGHANISITMDIYTHLNEKDKSETASKLNDYLATNF